MKVWIVPRSQWLKFRSEHCSWRCAVIRAARSGTGDNSSLTAHTI